MALELLAWWRRKPLQEWSAAREKPAGAAEDWRGAGRADRRREEGRKGLSAAEVVADSCVRVFFKVFLF